MKNHSFPFSQLLSSVPPPSSPPPPHYSYLLAVFPFLSSFFRPTCHSSLKELLEGKHPSLFVTHIPLLTFPEIRVKGAAPPPGRHPSAPPPSPPPPSPPPPCFLLFRTLWPGRGSPPRRLPRPPCQLWQGSAKEGQT